MVQFDESFVIAHELKLAAAKRKKSGEPEKVSSTEAREMKLHDKIIKHCMDQWPRWKYIRARPDQASGIQKGCQDFTLFLPGGRTLCIECKSSTGKLSTDQLIWKHEMSLLGHTVHEVRSMEEFLQLVQ